MFAPLYLDNKNICPMGNTQIANLRERRNGDSKWSNRGVE